MVGRLRGRLLLLLAGLLLQTGCVSLLDSGLTTTGDDPGTKKEVTLAPTKSVELHLNLADKFEKNGLLGEAAAQLELARKENPNLKDVDHRLAILYDEIGNVQQALDLCKKKLAENPKNLDLLNDVGSFYYDLGSWSEAESYFRQAVAIDPQYLRAWNNLGMALGQQERYTEGMEAFSKAVRPAEAECNMAFILDTQGKRAEAREACLRALKLDPNSQLARQTLLKLDAKGGAGDVQHTSAKPAG